MSDNAWIALPDSAVAGWEARASDLPALVEAVIGAGESTGMFRVTTAAPDGGGLQRFDYRAHLRAGAAPFELAPEEAPPGRRLVTPGHICWQEHGAVQHGEVGDLGALLRRLRPDAAAWAERFMAHVPPVIVRSRGPRVRIDLPTDIWFPRILGVLDGDAPPPPAAPQRDNAALAHCHTPRLNEFLARIRAAADQWEQVWPEGIAGRYADMTDESGIRLR